MPFRPAAPEDLDALAAFHLRLWGLTYGDIAPAEIARTLTPEVRRDRWRAKLAAPDPGVWLEEDAAMAEGLAGFVAVGPPGHPAFGARGEVKHLFVDPQARGRGLGAALLRHGFGLLAGAGFPAPALAVVEENTAARGFYAAQGGRETGRFTDPGPVWRSRNVLVTWDAAPATP